MTLLSALLLVLANKEAIHLLINYIFVGTIGGVEDVYRRTGKDIWDGRFICNAFRGFDDRNQSCG